MLQRIFATCSHAFLVLALLLAFTLPTPAMAAPLEVTGAGGGGGGGGYGSITGGSGGDGGAGGTAHGTASLPLGPTGGIGGAGGDAVINGSISIATGGAGGSGGVVPSGSGGNGGSVLDYSGTVSSTNDAIRLKAGSGGHSGAAGTGVNLGAGGGGGSGQSLRFKSIDSINITELLLTGGDGGNTIGNLGGAGGRVTYTIENGAAVTNTGTTRLTGGLKGTGVNGGNGGNVFLNVSNGIFYGAAIELNGYHSSTNSGTAALNVGDGTTSGVVIAQSLKFIEHSPNANDGHGNIRVDKNSILRVKDVDLHSETGAGGYSTFEVSTANGQAIFGDDKLGWDSGSGLNHPIGVTNWLGYQLAAAGKNPADYQGGSLAYLGYMDGTQVRSLNLSKVAVGIGTIGVNPGSNGAFGNQSLTSINAPYFITNSNYYNYNSNGVAAITLNAGAGGNPFATGALDKASLLLVVDQNTKVGDQLIALQNVNSGGAAQNFSFAVGHQGWLKEGNAFSTSRLLNVAVTQGAGMNAHNLYATFLAADPTKTLPGVSRSTARLLTQMVTQIGHTIGYNVVGTSAHISSGVHFISRAADFLYMPSAVVGAKTIETAMQLGAVSGMQATTSQTNFAAANTVHDRIQDLGAFAAMPAQQPALGFGLWVKPLYLNNTMEDASMGSFNYGYDSNFFGVVAGADFTTASNLRLGAAFSIGSGSTDSNSSYTNVENDFDYLGVSLYGGWNYGGLTLSGDVSYSLNKGEVSQKLPATMLMQPLTADVDTKILGIGGKAAYTFDAKVLDITPFAGVRFMNITTDGYRVRTDTSYSPGADGRVFNVGSDTQNVWHFPVGVQFSKDMETENGLKITPSFELGAIFAAGDMDATSTARIPGVIGSATNKAKVFDTTTFDAKAGLGIKKDNLRLDLTYNYQASTHHTGHAAGAMFTYEF